ncbi:MAG: peptidoglycan-binding protein [Verrucomicrobiaceae bacterium]|nr:peptidoglycan-binding protein [Verrucomicrobiaceae bacterium]
MNTRCPFDLNTLSFSGSPLQQARCLLRAVERGGNVQDAPATLPPALETLLTTPETLGTTVAQVRAYMQQHGITESTSGGSLDDPVSRANGNSPNGRKALYFLIHDTSSKLKPGQTFDPNFINTDQWSGNNLANQAAGRTHIYINRLGKARTDNDYRTAFRATQFELRPQATIPGADPKSVVFKGLCLHHELIQPRLGPGSSDIESPVPGFTQSQYERLALQYIIASVRRGSWMIPAFHCVIDLKVGDHDDPQHFDLAAWDSALAGILAAVRGVQGGGPPPPPPPPARLRSALLAADPILAEVATGNRVLGFSQAKSVIGVGTMQDALNLLADHGQPSLAIPGAQGNSSSRGFYGNQTVAAVRSFQTISHLAPTDGQMGKDTLLALDAAVLALEASSGSDEDLDGAKGTSVGPFTTPATSSSTANGKGGSTTTGLNGDISQAGDGTVVTDAVETLTARREGASLGTPRTVRQIRTQKGDTTSVHQPDYCWGTRVLPDAELVENHPGLSGAGVFTGRATFFGKSDNIDEGTGTPAYGTTQTNSSVFGISLKEARLLAEGLATKDSKGLHPTEKGLRARVEVFFPDTRRLVRLPLVDVGPKPSINAIADLTVAASCFLQKLSEDEVVKPGNGKIDNINVKARIIS